MTDRPSGAREGSLEAPTRHPLAWRDPAFYDETALLDELERVFDICHGCRRCVSLCQAFPTLFDLVDESETLEVDGVAREDYWKVVDHCYLCDLCFMTKCPYVPPHEWDVDFPHLMLRAKAVRYRQGRTRLRDRLITRTDAVGRFASLPVVVGAVNAANRSPAVRGLLDRTLGIAPDARLPEYHADTLTRRLSGRVGGAAPDDAVPAGPTRGRVALFATCYGNYNEPALGEDLVAVLEHNAVPVRLADGARCCAMPRLELGDLESVRRAREHNVPLLAALVDEGWDLTAPVPSCVLMFRQELPLMFPDDEDVARVAQAFFDPFEYLGHRHRAGRLRTDFARGLGKVAYHAACHQRVQNVGPRTRAILELVPDTEVVTVERCSGHDGTYAVKSECREASLKIARPPAAQIARAEADHYGSDCPIAAHHLEQALGTGVAPEHPLTLLRRAYGI